MAQNGMTYSQIQKDTHLQEIIALAIEAQVKEKVNRASIRVLFPAPTVMARKLPIMKEKIDSKFFCNECFSLK